MNLNKTTEYSGKYELVNTLESIVIQELRSLWRQHGNCKCEKCFFDVCAIALNSLKPKYTTTHEGNIIASTSMMNRENLVEVQIALSKAMNMVAQSPKHDVEL